MLVQVTTVSHVICAVAFGLAAILLLTSRAQHRYKALLLGSCIATTLWAAVVVVGQVWSSYPWILRLAAEILEQLRSLSWIGVMAFVFFVAYRKRMDPSVGGGLGIITIANALYIAAVAVYVAAGHEPSALALRLAYVARVLVAVVALLLVENLFRNSGREARWAVKNLCFGLGAIFAYDFYLYAEAVLFTRVDPDFYAARGLIDGMAVPFIIVAAARSKSWPIDLHVSRRLVFHSATLLAAGAYLILMAGVSYYLRALESPWSAIIQAAFLVAAVLVLAIVLSSGSLQARLKEFINRNFFSYKYDYRLEWLRFIAAISDNLTELTIPDRIIRALANIIESTGGALWVYRSEDDAYLPVARWNMGDGLPGVAATDSLVAALAARQGVVDVAKRQVDGMKADLPLPSWLTDHPRIWLIIPLVHGSSLIGFVILGPSRAPRELVWEDFELLKTAGRQAASYVAEESAARSLARSKRFEDFNQQFSFVVHDIKNLAGQMTLILKNAERHGDNPAFQKDVLATIRDSVTRLRTMLEQLRGAGRQAVPAARLDLVAVLGRIIEDWKLQIPGLRVSLPDTGIDVVADTGRLTAVFNHLIQNAFDAAGIEGHVSIGIQTNRDGKTAESPLSAAQDMWVVVTVTDDGPGMDQQFIQEKLFQPLESTKSTGFGLGAFQVRQLVREMGGRLDVTSKVGEGTSMIVRLPIAVAAGRDSSPEEPSQALRMGHG